MKKILSFALALAMALSLAACGGGDNSPATSSAQQESSASSGASSSEETPDASQPADESQEADSSQVEDQPQTDVVPTFDPNWADPDHPMPIPQPPFQYEVEFDDRGRCTIRSTDVDEISGMPLDTIIDYCETVKALGYSNSLQENVLVMSTHIKWGLRMEAWAALSVLRERTRVECHENTQRGLM